MHARLDVEVLFRQQRNRTIPAAASVNGVIIPQTGIAPINEKSIKTSAGGIFKVPISRVSHLKDAIYMCLKSLTQVAWHKVQVRN